MKGVVAAGHWQTAQAGASMLREGGNAVDAAVASVLTSFVCEPLLTGPGAGGFMLVHTPDGESRLLDFFVSSPGFGLTSTSAAELVPAEVFFSESAGQVFNVGPASCGVYGAPAGIAHALERFGSVSLEDVCSEPARLAASGATVTPMQEYLFKVLEPVLRSSRESSSMYMPSDRLPRAGEKIRLGELCDLLDRLGQEGPGFLYTGDVGEAISDWVLERGGLITRSDLANYEVLEREPVSATYRAREVVTNPPPSAGGILIIYALELLERVQRAGDLRALVEVMNQANTARSEEFVRCLHRPGMAERLVGVENIDRMASRVLSKLGSTTHIAVLDELGGCASVTCSNGSGSGVAVPGTGVHLNNMMGEQDLNPFGYHTYQPGYRMPSMMAPTVVTSDERPEIVLGSAGSNRIRSAILQTIVNVVEHDMGLTEAVASPRMHLEGLAIDAEPGIDASALASLQADGWPVRRWEQQNLFFGGVQACGFDRRTDTMVGAGDPRRGGASAVVD